MRVKTDNTAVNRFYDEELMGDEYDPPGIKFNKPKPDGTRTSQEMVAAVAERLVSEVEGIEALDTETDNEDKDNEETE